MAGDEFDWVAWRREARRSLIAARRALAEDDRRRRNGAIDALLEQAFGALGGRTVGFCWPFGGEPEPRFAVRRWRAAGSRAALPVVVAPRSPLEFREWWPGAPMATGVYDIPYPVDTPVLEPEAAVVPVNGFDAAGYRLGYGGGYFDRTLAALPGRPLCIGLGYEVARMRTIHPQPHDVPFDFIVTEAGIEARSGERLERVSAADADARVRALLDRDA
ncbi:MAG: 5-formyltetrahydrofolate cyclo-ligase [Halofilum sp. (in: g-proteobacteria)]|nr:5-formyltetrahydrofolate cyclo-ligase [Halofilum sp. (in: g-proteobacteria)]